MKDSKKSKLIAIGILCAGLFLSANLSAEKVGRKIQITWDASEKKLELLEDKSPKNPYGYKLKKDDSITLIGQGKPSDIKQIKIEYGITGLDISALFSRLISGILAPAYKSGLVQETLHVTDDLLPGGILTVTFRVVKQTNDEDTKVIKFRIEDEYPWFFGSAGMVFTNARDPEVAIVKKSNIITYDVDGETQQAYEQIIIKKNNTGTFRPLQTVVSFLNFRVYKPVYLSLGFSVNQSIFSEPMLGLSYYFRFKNVGLVSTCGIHFSKEIEFNSLSEFGEGQTVDPELGLTVEDISTEEEYKIRLFLGVSFRF